MDQNQIDSCDRKWRRLVPVVLPARSADRSVLLKSLMHCFTAIVFFSFLFSFFFFFCFALAKDAPPPPPFFSFSLLKKNSFLFQVTLDIRGKRKSTVLYAVEHARKAQNQYCMGSTSFIDTETKPFLYT